MIFMFISGLSPDCRAPDYDLDKIAKLIETRADGASPEKVLNLNKAAEVLSAKPSIEFELELKYHRFDELVQEIMEGQPPIVWVSLYDRSHTHKCAHAIVLTNIEDGRVLFNDPMFGKQSELLESFITRWDDVDRIVIKVKIGKKKQKMLEEFNGSSASGQGEVIG
jgi:hypothetical protein